MYIEQISFHPLSLYVKMSDSYMWFSTILFDSCVCVWWILRAEIFFFNYYKSSREMLFVPSSYSILLLLLRVLSYLFCGFFSLYLRWLQISIGYSIVQCCSYVKMRVECSIIIIIIEIIEWNFENKKKIMDKDFSIIYVDHLIYTIYREKDIKDHRKE